METKDHDLEIRKLQSSCIGQRYSGASLSKIDGSQSWNRTAGDWIQNPKGFLIFLGAPGVGKTYFCAGLIELLYKKYPRHAWRYFKERELLSRLRQEIEKGCDYIDAIPHIIDHDFLMLDDVGSSGFNDWRREVLFAAIDYRYELKKPTVITSNLTREELTSGLGQRSLSRLFAAENVIITNHEGHDLRKDGL